MPFFKAKNGLNIYYEQHGTHGEPVILLHGLGSSTQVWACQYPALSRHFQIYAFDFPGHGKSDWTTQYSFEMLTGILKDFHAFLGMPKIALVALSVGSIVALNYAATDPDAVSHLVLEGPVAGGAPVYHPYFLLDTLMFRALPFLPLLAMGLFGYEKTMHVIDTFGIKNDKNLVLIESLQQKADKRALRQLLIESALPPYLGKLENITAPLLVIRGKNDPMPRRFCTYIQNHVRGPKACILVEGVRHLVALEKPAVFNQRVIHFLQPSQKLGEGNRALAKPVESECYRKKRISV